MDIVRHSPVAHAAYNDLVHSLRNAAVADVRGVPTLVQRGSRKYWYDTYRIGSEVKKTYIGEDCAELRDRLTAVKSLRSDRDARRRNQARLVRQLRADNFLSVDGGLGSLLNAFAAAGVFRLGGTIVGTQAFRLYEGELGIRLTFDQSAQTGDIDIASFQRLSFALKDAVSDRLQDVLKDFAFEPVPSLDREKGWRWRQTRNETFVEFLTPSFGETEDLQPLPALGVHAQSLHFLNYLIADPIFAAAPYRNGVLVQIPRPERFAIHKLIVANRRLEGPDSLKAVKDTLQAEFLIKVLLEDRPDDLHEAIEDAMARGTRWRERIGSTIRRSRTLTDHLGQYLA